MKYQVGDVIYGWSAYSDIMGQPLTITEVIDWGQGKQWYRVAEFHHILCPENVSHIKFLSISELQDLHKHSSLL